MYGGDPRLIGGGALAATGLGLPFGWYFAAAAVLLVVGFVLVRVALRRRTRRTARTAG